MAHGASITDRYLSYPTFLTVELFKKCPAVCPCSLPMQLLYTGTVPSPSLSTAEEYYCQSLVRVSVLHLIRFRQIVAKESRKVALFFMRCAFLSARAQYLTYVPTYRTLPYYALLRLCLAEAPVYDRRLSLSARAGTHSDGAAQFWYSSV